jgi:general stress protein YciG
MELRRQQTMTNESNKIEGTNWEVVAPSKRGFAGMTPEKRREIARMGGKSVPKEKRAYSVNRDLAAKSGAKGGKKVRPSKRAFSMDPTLASRAGKASAKARAKP